MICETRVAYHHHHDFARSLVHQTCNQGSSVGITRAKTRQTCAEGIDRLRIRPARGRRRSCRQSPRARDRCDRQFKARNELRRRDHLQGRIYPRSYTEGQSAAHPGGVTGWRRRRDSEAEPAGYRALDCRGFARIDFLFEPSTNKVTSVRSTRCPLHTIFMFTALGVLRTHLRQTCSGSLTWRPNRPELVPELT